LYYIPRTLNVKVDEKKRAFRKYSQTDTAIGLFRDESNFHKIL